MVEEKAGAALEVAMATVGRPVVVEWAAVMAGRPEAEERPVVAERMVGHQTELRAASQEVAEQVGGPRAAELAAQSRHTKTATRSFFRIR